MGGYFLGIDNGLTVSKAAIFDVFGNEIAVSKKATCIINRQGLSEIDMGSLWADTVTVIREVIEKSKIVPGQILAIGNCGHGNGVYLIDHFGKPLTNAITSMDHRADEIVRQVKREYEMRLRSLTLQGLWDGQPGIILKWLKNHNPDIYHHIGSILFCKDWIKYCLTGEISTDFSDVSASGLLDNINRVYSEEILDLLDIKEMRCKLPKVLKSYEIAGYVTKEASMATGLKRGTPVVAGQFDVDACGIGAGFIGERQYGMIAGTWNIGMALSLRPVQSDKIRQCTIRGDGTKYLAIDSSPTSASNLDWFIHNVLGGDFTYQEVQRTIASYGPRDINVIFLPFIYSGLMDDNPGALFCNLRSNNTKNDMIRAVIEGICFAHHYHIRNLQLSDLDGDTICFTGGASKNEVWCKMFSDITGIKVQIPESSQSGALGTCIMAGMGMGIFNDIEDAVKHMVKVKKIYHPNYRNHAQYQNKYRLFLEMADVVKNINFRI